MKKIIIHWTAGGPVPTSHDKEYYHYLVDSLGHVHNGKFKPEANEICKPNLYAAHTGGGNTGAIGISMCGMYGFKSKEIIGNFPITKIQFEKTMQLCAKLTEKYGINITPNTIQTHYEFGKQHPQSSSAGKIDIIFLPPYSWVKQDDIGNFIRTKIKWYLGK